MTAAEGEVDKRITRAIMEYKLIEEGDRILIALSGGKDSLALAWNLARKARGFPLHFTLEAAHLVTEFTSPDQPDTLKNLLAAWGLNLRLISHPEASSCFGCARDRRRTLLETAAAEGFNKIALGHHMDDSLITLLMNMSWNAELAAMPPMLPASRGAPSIIRPLILLQESAIIRLVKETRWPIERCNCPLAGDSRRTEFATVLKQLTGDSPKRTWNLWRSLSNIKPDLLPSSASS
ncbi:MAG: tRNA 2-thiocytidine biosynthesis protein TtcA [Spirochaetaceae bacterium]|nr:tRNA 2-thiocytidine biosynthesis protein TtcA [Spirochaetaceae bacterium]